MPRAFNCCSTIRWRCAAKSAAVGPVGRSPCVAIAAKSRYCATIRIPEDSAARAAAKESAASFEIRYRTAVTAFM